MTFLITGAGRGLGLEFTGQLLERKKNVIAWLRDPGKSPELKALAEKHPDQLQIQKVDVANLESVATAARQITGPLDVLINNAGILLDFKNKFSELSIQKMQETFAVNVYAPMQVAQYLLPALQKSSSPMLINISSRMGSIDDDRSGGYYAYRMSKASLNMFTRNFSVDFPKIKTLSVHPGWVKTSMGGPDAAITAEESVNGLLRVILEHQRYMTGSFVNYDGAEIPW